MEKEVFEARHLIIEIKDVEDGQYGMSKAYPVSRMNNEELLQNFIAELKHIKDLGYIIHYQI